MHRWNKLVFIALITGMLGAAAPAHATQVPFDFDIPVPLDMFSVGVSGSDNGTGFVGGCDVELQCVGASVSVSSTQGGANFGNARVVLSGSLCARDMAAPCGSAGDPGTGFVFTRRELVVEGSQVDLPEFTLEFCTWEQAPRNAPTACETFEVAIDESTPVALATGSSDLSGIIPEKILI